jgi:predicted lactoylglutathione lyase
MSRKVFINLPVSDLKKSMEFFTQLGYAFNPQFTDDNAACMVISDEIYSMLLTHQRFADFIPGSKISDAHSQTEVLVALNCESRAEVDATLDKAIAAGAKIFRPAADHGFMYERSFRDLDGHIWEMFWMDPSAIPPA